MTRLTILAASFFLLLTIGETSVFGNQSCKPVVGHFEASVVPPGQGHCPPIPPHFVPPVVSGGVFKEITSS